VGGLNPYGPSIKKKKGKRKGFTSNGFGRSSREGCWLLFRLVSIKGHAYGTRSGGSSLLRLLVGKIKKLMMLKD